MSALVVFLAIAALLFLLGAWVLAAKPSESVNRTLGVLLLLLAGSTVAFGRFRATGEPVFFEMILWYELPALFLMLLLLDQLFLPQPRSLWRKGALAVGGGLTGLLLVALLVQPELFNVDHARDIGRWDGVLVPFYGLSFYVAWTIAVVVGALVACSVSRTRVQRKQGALVALAFGFLIGHAGTSRAMQLLFSQGQVGNAKALATLLFGVAGVLALLWAIPRLADPFRGRIRVAIGVLAVAPILVGSLDGNIALPVSLGELLEPVVPGYRNSRPVWLGAFAVTMAVAVVRYGLAGFGRHARSRMARSTAWALGIAVAGMALVAGLAWLGWTGGGLVVVGLAAGGALMLSTSVIAPAARPLVGWLLLDPEGSEVRHEQVRIYANALQEAMDPQTPPAVRRERLTSMRENFGLSEEEHEMLEAALSDHEGSSARLLLGRYLIERQLDRGGQGRVLLARDLLIGRDVVVKRLPANERGDLLVEVRALGRVHHPHVLTLFDAERVGDDLFLVLEYAPGGSLDILLDEDGALSLEAAIGRTGEVLTGLDALHEADLVHGDIKPENILLDADGRAKVADLGLATRRSDRRAPTSGGWQGTPSVMAPEQLAGQPASVRSDVYSAGALLYRLVTGEHYLPLEQLSPAALEEMVLEETPRLDHPRLPTPLTEVIGKALAKEPAERYGSAAEMAEALAIAAGRLDEQHPLRV